VGNTFQEEVDYLKSWLLQRTAWMDANMFGNPCDLSAGIMTKPVNELVKIFPNPIVNNQDIQIQSLQPIHRIEFFNSIGQLQWPISVSENQTSGSYRTNIHTALLPAGMYTVRVVLQNNQVIHQKILIL
jgi:hypothetical protein